MSSTKSGDKPLKISHRLALLEARLRGVEDATGQLIKAFEQMDACVVAMDRFFVRNFGNDEQKELLRKADLSDKDKKREAVKEALDGLLPTIVEKNLETGEETATKVAEAALVSEQDVREREMEEREEKLRELDREHNKLD